MKSRLIFSNGVWRKVNVPKGHDPSWNSADFWYYGSMFAAAEAKGYSHREAESIAEAAVTKRLYPGVVYYPKLEEQIALISRE